MKTLHLYRLYRPDGTDKQVRRIGPFRFCSLGCARLWVMSKDIPAADFRIIKAKTDPGDARCEYCGDRLKESTN